MTKTALLKALKAMPKDGWSVRYEKTGKGDYGKREIYSCNGKPIYALEIDFTSGGKCTAKWLAESV